MIKKVKSESVFLGYLFVMISTGIWSGNFIIARSLNQMITPVSLAFWRWFVAVIAILPFSFKALLLEREIIKKNLAYLSMTGLLGITLFNTLIYYAGQTTTAINLSLISITFPVFIIILSNLFYHEKVNQCKVIGIILVVAGVILLITKGDFSKLYGLNFAIGDIWMLVAAFTFALYSILLKRRPKNLSLWAFQSSLFILGFIFLLPFFILECIFHPIFEIHSGIIFSILYVGIFASLIAFILWNKAIEAIGPSKAGMVYYTMPLFSGLWSYFLLKENISPIHLYSVLLIISGILLSNYEAKGKK